MSDEASSSAAAAHPFDDIQDGRPHDALPTAADLAKKRTRNRQLFNKKRGELLDDLLRSVDILVYAELSTIYYMEYVQSMRLCDGVRMADAQQLLLHPSDPASVGAIRLPDPETIHVPGTAT